MAEIGQTAFASDGIYTATLLLPFLGAAVASDLLSRRVPNILVLLMLAFGVALHLATAPSAGSALTASLGGAGVGLVILLPFYAFGGMGAGDVKLLAATGSFLGPQGALVAGICTLAAGAVLGLIVIAFCYLGAYPLVRRLVGVAPAENPPTIQLPYSLAISAGALMAVMR